MLCDEQNKYTPDKTLMTFTGKTLSWWVTHVLKAESVLSSTKNKVMEKEPFMNICRICGVCVKCKC